MKYLLDTNIVSERIKIKPSQNLIKWLDSVPQESLYLSVISVGEIKKGIERLNLGNKRSKLELWVEQDVVKWFMGRVLDIDLEIMSQWAFITAEYKPQGILDSLIAATALANNLKLVTRNIKDFSIYPGLELIDPF